MNETGSDDGDDTDFPSDISSLKPKIRNYKNKDNTNSPAPFSQCKILPPPASPLATRSPLVIPGPMAEFQSVYIIYGGT